MKRKVKLSISLFGFLVLMFFIISCVANSHAESSKSTNYQELKKDGRIYVFTKAKHRVSFKKTGEVDKWAIMKIGYSPDGRTFIFDSPEAVKEYESRRNIR